MGRSETGGIGQNRVLWMIPLPTASQFKTASRLGFAIKCDGSAEAGVYLQFWSRDYLGGDEYRSFQYRIDSKAATDDQWQYDDESAFIFENSKAERIAKELMSASTLAVHAYTYNYDVVEAVFDLAGANEAIGRILSVCSR
jgi:hypothetical protein